MRQGAIIEPLPGGFALPSPDFVGDGAHDGRPTDGDAVRTGRCDEDGRGKTNGFIRRLERGGSCPGLGEGDVKLAGRAGEEDGREQGGKDERTE